MQRQLNVAEGQMEIIKEKLYACETWAFIKKETTKNLNEAIDE